jgi:hypothetical protein
MRCISGASGSASKPPAAASRESWRRHRIQQNGIELVAIAEDHDAAVSPRIECSLSSAGKILCRAQLVQAAQVLFFPMSVLGDHPERGNEILGHYLVGDRRN